MWPKLQTGNRVEVLLSGRRRPLAAVLLAIGDAGELSLALTPSTNRRAWRPLQVERFSVRALFDRGPLA